MRQLSVGLVSDDANGQPPDGVVRWNAGQECGEPRRELSGARARVASHPPRRDRVTGSPHRTVRRPWAVAFAGGIIRLLRHTSSGSVRDRCRGAPNRASGRRRRRSARARLPGPDARVSAAISQPSTAAASSGRKFVGPAARLRRFPFAELGDELQQPRQAVRPLETRAALALQVAKLAGQVRGVRFAECLAAPVANGASGNCRATARAASGRAPPNASRSSRRTPASARRRAGVASLFRTWAILFGYSCWTQASARRANRSASCASTGSEAVGRTAKSATASGAGTPHPSASRPVARMAPMSDLLARARAFLAEDPDPETRGELEALLKRAEGGDDAARKDLADRFSGPLVFGTAGLRGRVEAGLARMNRLVVIKAGWGFGSQLLERRRGRRARAGRRRRIRRTPLEPPLRRGHRGRARRPRHPGAPLPRPGARRR